MAKKPFSTKEFKALEKEWKEKLKESGFEDIETDSGHLKDINRRTIAFDNRDAIYEFFMALNSYIQDHKIPLRDKNILELYCQGYHVKGVNGIADLSGWSYNLVYNTIRKYKAIVLKKN